MAKNMKEMLERKLAENSQRHAEARQEADFDVGRQYTKLRVDLIDPNPYQPRTSFPQAELETLAASIHESGLLQPISVRQFGERFQVIAGERRLRAHQLLGKQTIEAIIVPADESEMATLALAENIDRADLSDYEIGKALRQVENLFPSKKRLAESVGLNREDMYRYFAFEALPKHILTRLDNQPRLLSRSAAADVKRVLQNVNVEAALAHAVLEEGWVKLENGELEQTKLASWLTREISARMHSDSATPDKSELIQIARAGKKVGSWLRDEKHLVLKLNAMALSDAQKDRLQHFVHELISENV